MILSQEQQEIKSAHELVEKSQLKRVRLRNCSVNLQGEESALRAPFRLAQSHNTSAVLSDHTLRIEVAFTFQCFDSSDGKVALFAIQCSFDLDYQIEDGYHPQPEAINAFKDGNAIFNCWPYAREFVQNLTARMTLNPPPLPLLRIVPKKGAAPQAEKPTPEATPTSAVKS